MNERYAICDAEAAAAENPATFRIPDQDDRNGLEEGDFAKCIFIDPDGQGERMWVQVSGTGSCSCCGDLTYFGRCSNKPTAIKYPEFGEAVTFSPRNVIQIMKKEDAIVGPDKVNISHMNVNNPDL